MQSIRRQIQWGIEPSFQQNFSKTGLHREKEVPRGAYIMHRQVFAKPK